MIKKLLLIILIALFSVQFQNQPVHAEDPIPTVDQSMSIESKSLDNRALILRDYLASRNSPLQYHSQDFIDAADTYGVDWKLVPAIAGVESTFGKFTPGGYNGWGWGVYGTQAIYFQNWRHGIFTVTKGLKDGYISKGLTTPQQMNRKYASSPTWGSKVGFIMADIDRFSKNYQLTQTATSYNLQLEEQIESTAPKTTSEKLALIYTTPSN